MSCIRARRRGRITCSRVRFPHERPPLLIGATAAFSNVGLSAEGLVFEKIPANLPVDEKTSVACSGIGPVERDLQAVVKGLRAWIETGGTSCVFMETVRPQPPLRPLRPVTAASAEEEQVLRIQCTELAQRKLKTKSARAFRLQGSRPSRLPPPLH